MKVRGVNGVLQTLLTEPLESETARAEDSERRQKAHRKKATPASSASPAMRARLGRPPHSSSSYSSRQKVTFRIRPDLIETYRDWSWDARTSLSHLVEAALADYFTRCGR